MSGVLEAPRRSESLLLQLIANGGAEAATRSVQLLSLSLAGWFLGVPGVAVIGPSWALAAMALGTVQSGPEWISLRNLSLTGGNADSAAQAVADATLLKLLLVLASVPVLFAALVALGHGDGPALRQLAAQIGAMALTAFGYAWVFRGLDRTVELAANRLVQAAVNIAVLVPLLLVWKEPLALPVAESVAALSAVVLARRRLGSLCGGRSVLHRVRPMLGPALAFGLAGTLSTFCWLAPLLAAARWSSAQEISHLTGVLRLILGLQGVIGIVLITVFPALARLYESDPRRARAVLLALMAQLGAGAALAVAALGALAPVLVPALFGPEFAAAVPLFRGMAPILIPVAVSAPLILALTARARDRAVIQSAAVTAGAMAIGCAAAFWLTSSVWSALVMHPVLWGQVAMTLWVASRHGVFSLRAAMPEAARALSGR